MKAHAIIQARTGSSRLPGKIMLEVLGKTILEYFIERVRKARSIAGIIIATTIKNSDSRIVEAAERLGLDVYRGSEDDVMDRFYQAAKLFKVQHIIRVTPDCPLLDPQV